MSISRLSLEELELFINNIQCAKDLEQIFNILQKQINILGFEKMTYWLRWHRSESKKPILITSYPEKFVEHYIAENFQSHDMVGQISNFKNTAFAWSDIGKNFEITPKQKILFHDSQSAGLKSGGSIPIHGPGLVKATFSVANNEDTESFNKLFSYRKFDLQIIATYAHEKILSLGLDGPVLINTLTPREADILSWVASGKSYWEISVINSIQEDTVKKHMQKICQKLGVSNKSHAISKAIINGLITP